MPVLTDMTARPEWCELEWFAIHQVGPSSQLTWHAPYPANKLVVVEGRCDVLVGDQDHRLDAGAFLDAAEGTHMITSPVSAEVALLGGHWEADTGGSGIFAVAEEDAPQDGGDPVSYEKRVSFDRHYHDCDEYWIIVHGRGTAVSEDVHYPVGPGDCVATRMGHHHDFSLVEEPIRAVYFETTLRGHRRLGHLWEHTHGPAVPPAEVPVAGG